ncbi:MAG TPA: hypothetical protein VLH08_21470 [Acidobacteriota bacterium]|nr:hypothetical protein [Acidobacteriota bacterium]
MRRKPWYCIVVKGHLLTVGLFLFSLATASALNLPGAPNCPIFPENNVWNKEITQLPVHRNSAALIRSIGLNDGLHPDFGSNLSYGIPYNVVGGGTPKVRVNFYYDDESDAGPYPIPANPKMEAGGDRHILIVDRDACKLYEIYDSDFVNGRWEAGSGAIWNLRSNLLRPNNWTSADAAGLPILPGLVRFDEVSRGVINHALRFTASTTRDQHIYPARHHAGASNDPSLPPMGLRIRLKPSFNISSFSPRNRVILTALKRYGMILADNGSPWFITGVSDRRWNADDLNQLKRIKGSAFEAVDTTNLRNGN